MPDQQLTQLCTQSGSSSYILGELMAGLISEVTPFVPCQHPERLY